MIARGTQNKILESMAMGVPVISTDVAAGGVDAVPGVHLLTANDPEKFAKQVLKVLDNHEFRTKLSVNGRDRVLQRHNWGASMQVLDGILATL
jgi:glycosyltransferase involved in cell wall biosynthesis